MSFDESKYKNTMSYPKESDYYRYTVLTDEGEKVGVYDSKDMPAFGEDMLKACKEVSHKVRTEGKASAVFNDYVVVIKYDKDEYREYQKQYREETARLENMFYRDCCEDHGVDPDSKLAGVIFCEAYERGHSSGYHEVYNKFDTFSDLADRIIEAYKTE